MIVKNNESASWTAGDRLGRKRGTFRNAGVFCNWNLTTETFLSRPILLGFLSPSGNLIIFYYCDLLHISKHDYAVDFFFERKNHPFSLWQVSSVIEMFLFTRLYKWNWSVSVCPSSLRIWSLYLLVGLTDPYNHTYSESLWWKLFKNHKRTQIQRQRHSKSHFSYLLFNW